MKNCEYFFHLFDIVTFPKDNEEKRSKLFANHQDYDIFVINFRKEVETFFSCQKEKKKNNKRQIDTENVIHDLCTEVDTQVETTESRVRSVRILIKEKSEIAKLKLTLTCKEETLYLDTDSTIFIAKTSVTKYKLKSGLLDSDIYLCTKL